jgi:sulfotransferase
MTSGFLSQVSTKKPALQKNYYFMAGLPRSGSTLLSSILNQNPRFYSGPSSPVLSTMFVVENHLMNDELYHGYPKSEQGHEIISNIINHFYSDVTKPVVVDKNRAWVARVPYIEQYIGQKAKIICPVRDIDEILTSMITMIRRNPYKEGNPRINFIDEQLVKLNIPINDDNRCEYIAGPDGILGQSLNATLEGLNQGFGNCFHFVEYQDLVKKPKETLNKIYEFLGEEPYDHQFDNLKNQNREGDMNTYGLTDMHEVRPELKSTSKDPKKVLSKKVLDKCEGMDFWRAKNYNQSIATIPNNIVTDSNQVTVLNPFETKGFFNQKVTAETEE